MVIVQCFSIWRNVVVVILCTISIVQGKPTTVEWEGEISGVMHYIVLSYFEGG